MRNITVSNRQEVTDIAIQHCGGIDAVLDICLRNDISITEALKNGQELAQTNVINKFIKQYFVTEKIAPSSYVTALQKGIGIWKIELDFKVS